MNEEINNVVPNSYEPQRNNNGVKVLLIVLLILAIVVIGLLSYKIFVIDKKNNSNEVTTNTGEKYSKINYEIKKEKDGEMTWKYLYVNGKKIKDTRAEELKIEQYKDVLIVELSNPGPSILTVIVDKNGKVTNLDYELKVEKGWVPKLSSYRIEGNSIYVSWPIQYSQGHFDAECRIEDTSLLSSYEVKYEYMGNGKISDGEVVNKKTISDLYKNKCDKFIVFSDILTGKLCTRSNDKIKCYSDTQYNNLKDRLNEIFTEANCKNEDDAYYCELNDNYCRLNNDGVYCYTNYD